MARGNANAKSEIFEMLKDDHREVKKAFRQFESLDPEDDQEQMEALVTHTCAALEVHAQLEEECFYPAAREAIKSPDLLDEAEVEHGSAKALIETLKAMDSQDDKYAATFKVLGEYIKHHIKEEEGEMFAALERSRVDWQSVLQQMQERRAVLEQEYGLNEAEEDESSQDDESGEAEDTSEDEEDQQHTDEKPAGRGQTKTRAATTTTPRARRTPARGA